MLEITGKRKYTYDDVERIMELLRSDRGCPWDRAQTHASIRRNFIEEVYEAVEAIDLDDADLLQEELGDVLLQVVFHAQMASEAGRFDMGDVCTALCNKLIVRHPHIFGDVTVDGSDEVLKNWEDIKNQIKGVDTTHSAMVRIARSLPALIRAQKVQSKAQKVGFDFDNINDAMQKVPEELAELSAANTPADRAEEFGDLLFAVVNLSRFIPDGDTGVDPEQALSRATDKFMARFGRLEQAVLESGKTFGDLSLAQMDEIWREIKCVE